MPVARAFSYKSADLSLATKNAREAAAQAVRSALEPNNAVQELCQRFQMPTPLQEAQRKLGHTLFELTQLYVVAIEVQDPHFAHFQAGVASAKNALAENLPLAAKLSEMHAREATQNAMACDPRILMLKQLYSELSSQLQEEEAKGL